MKKIILISAVVLSSCGVFQKKSLVDLTKKGYTKIPLHEISKDDSRFCMYAFINGKKGKFLLDTGANGVFILKKSSQKFGLTPKQNEENIHFKVRKIEIDSVQISIADDKSESSLDGYIGFPFLEKGNAIIDYRDYSLYFTEENKMDLDSILTKKGYAKFPLELAPSKHIFCDAHINEKKGYFLVDTGAEQTVVGEPYKDKFGLKIDNSYKKIEIVATVKEIKTAQITTEDNTFQIGNLKLKNCYFVVLNIEPYQKLLEMKGFKKEMHGVIGDPILYKLNAIIDYGTNTLYLKK